MAAFATGLQHPRWVYVLPNGDVLVAEASAPERPEEGKGIKGRVMTQLHEEGGLRGAERESHHAVARRRWRWRCRRLREVFLEGLNSPFGMVLVGNDFYVANTDAVVRFPYQNGQTRITAQRREAGRPAGGPAQPPLDQEPHRQPRRHQALRHHRLEQQRGRARHGARRRDARRSGRSIARAAAIASSPPACAIRTASAGSRRAGSCGPWSTSATSSAAISCRTTSRRCSPAASTAGLTATTAHTSTRA